MRTPDTETDRSGETKESCAFCVMMTNPDEARIQVADSGQAAVFMSKRDGHPLIAPYRHVEGEETDWPSELAIAETWEWANTMTPYFRQAYRELYGATGFTLKANMGSQQNIKHYHIHFEAWRGKKDEEQIAITDPAEKAAFAQKVRDLMDPLGLTKLAPEPTHW